MKRTYAGSAALAPTISPLFDPRRRRLGRSLGTPLVPTPPEGYGAPGETKAPPLWRRDRTPTHSAPASERGAHPPVDAPSARRRSTPAPYALPPCPSQA